MISHFGRSDKVCTYLHYCMYKKFGIEAADKWYLHMHEAVCEHENITELWNEEV